MLPSDQTQQHKTGIHLSRYVRYMVADYAPLGKNFTVTIKWVTEADWYNKKARQVEKCPALVFEESAVQLKLTSHENCRTLARFYGPDADNWIGKCIVIRAEEMAMGDGEGGKKRTIKIVGEGKKQAKPAVVITTLEDLRAWAKQSSIDEARVEQALQDAGGLVEQAYALLTKKAVSQ